MLSTLKKVLPSQVEPGECAGKANAGTEAPLHDQSEKQPTVLTDSYQGRAPEGGSGGGGGGAGGSGQTHVAEVSRARSPNKIQQGAAVAGLRPHEGRNLVAHSMPDSTNRRPTDTLANGPVRPALQRGPSPNKIRRRSRSPPRKTEAASDSILPAAVAPAVTPAQLLSEAPAGNDGAGLAGEDTSALSEGPAATPVGRAVACGEEGGGGGYDGDEIQVSDCVLIRGFASACVRACVRARVRLSVSG